ncbi:MAG: hypothetical protein ACNI27_16975 [Desulfovibrio sp.]
MKKEQNDLIKNIKSSLDDENTQLDNLTRRRLTLARHKAIAQRNAKQQKFKIFKSASFSLKPIAGVMLAALLVLALWPSTDIQTNQPVPEELLADLEIFTAQDEIELYEELSFLEWLENEDHMESSYDQTY